MNRSQKVLIIVLTVCLFLLGLLFRNDIFFVIGIKNLVTILIFLYVIKKNVLKENINHLKSKRSLVAATVGTLLLVILNLTVYPDSTQNNEEIKNNIVHGIFLTLLIGGVLAPIGEELLFRYLIIHMIKSESNWHAGIMVSSILFAAVHVHGNLIEAIPYFITALIFGYSYMYSKSIFTPMIIHAVINSIGLIAMTYS